MDSPDSQPHGQFPTTKWTQIEQAGHGDDEKARSLLNDLLASYYLPLHAELKKHFNVDDHQANDWLQSFVEKKIVIGKLFAKADRSKKSKDKEKKVRFRSFLLTSLVNFVRDELSKDRRQRRMPSGGLVSIEEDLAQAVEDHQLLPDHNFDVAWGRGVLGEAAERMEADCKSKGVERTYEVFRLRLLEPILEGSEPIPHKELCRRLGFKTEEEAGNALITAKRMFRRWVRTAVARYERTEEKIDNEISELFAIFSEAG